MSKYRARLKDISSLEFAESKAKSRLTHIRRSMVRLPRAGPSIWGAGHADDAPCFYSFPSRCLPTDTAARSCSSSWHGSTPAAMAEGHPSVFTHILHSQTCLTPLTQQGTDKSLYPYVGTHNKHRKIYASVEFFCRMQQIERLMLFYSGTPVLFGSLVAFRCTSRVWDDKKRSEHVSNMNILTSPFS